MKQKSPVGVHDPDLIKADTCASNLKLLSEELLDIQGERKNPGESSVRICETPAVAPDTKG